MVGFEGDRPDGLVQSIRVRAINPHYPNLVLRECEIQGRTNGLSWKVGDEIGLHEGIWGERNGASVHAVIVEILND
jgi:hypothetical protein